MQLQVHKVTIPSMSSIGYGVGVDVETGEEISFCADHRPMRALGEAMRSAYHPPLAEIQPWQIL